MQRFCGFLSGQYRLQKVTNIDTKRRTAYVLYVQDQNKPASTVKTNLAAIPFFHDKIEKAKYHFPFN